LQKELNHLQSEISHQKSGAKTSEVITHATQPGGTRKTGARTVKGMELLENKYPKLLGMYTLVIRSGPNTDSQINSKTDSQIDSLS